MSLHFEESSFRDRDGFVFFEKNTVFRAIHSSYLDTWQSLLSSGFLQELVSKGKLVSFRENDSANSPGNNAALVLEVDRIPFISYPPEWTFVQLKRAALLTLDLQLKALDKGFSLKDASAYNVQFKGDKAVFIDLLSFEPYEEDSPWIAFGQFCRHFLGPLLLKKYNVPGVNALLAASVDGIPVETCAELLPFRSRFHLLAAAHIHAHARLTKKHRASPPTAIATISLPKKRLRTLLAHMRDGISNLKRKNDITNWTSYYDDVSYSGEGFGVKKKFLSEVLQLTRPGLCLDLGCNTGEFALLASENSQYVIACDSDEQVVTALVRKKKGNLLPLCIDLSNPTPAFGWNNTERASFLERSQNADCVLALALVHHLCISNNVPLNRLAGFFSRFRGFLVIEFVPLSDPQVKRLVVSRRDIFGDYTEQNFLSAFEKYFVIEREQVVPGSERKLFLMKRKVA